MIVLLLDLVLIVMVSQLLGRLAQRVGQPSVIGEIVAGILLGPTLLGEQLSGVLFPYDIRSYLTAFANVGVMIFMFVAGLEMDLGLVVRHRRSVAAIAFTAYIVPFALGSAVAVLVLMRYRTGGPAAFTIFVGASMAITAFPVLVRILRDRGMSKTRVGQLAMTSAAVNDVAAWCFLAIVIGMVKPTADHQWRLLLFVPLVIVLWWIVRSALCRLTRGTESGSHAMIVVGVSGALVLGAATEWIGLHLIFGSFLFGVVFPRRLRVTVEDGARPLSAIFLPAFFVIAGLQVDLGALDRSSIGELLAILLAAVVGKTGGTYIAARLSRIDRVESLALGALMNTRGLTELVILNVGLSIGLIDKRLYALLVIMALVTTAMTSPLLRLGDILAKRLTPAEYRVAAEPELSSR